MGAWLRRNDIADDPMYTLASARLEGDDSLHAIENAVYDHPAVLDDFEADIVVTTARYMFVPAELADDADLCVMAFSTVFGDTSAEDVMTDTVGEYAVLYMAVPGLRQFLARTFAGSRVACHATTLLSHWQRVAKAGLCRHSRRICRHGIVPRWPPHCLVAPPLPGHCRCSLLYA